MKGSGPVLPAGCRKTSPTWPEPPPPDPEPPPFTRASTRASAVTATTAVVISAIRGADLHRLRRGSPPPPSPGEPASDGWEGGPEGGWEGGPEGGPDGGWEGGPANGPEGGPAGRPEEGGSALTSTPHVGFPRRFDS